MEYFLDYTKTPSPEELDEFWYEERNEWDDETESIFTRQTTHHHHQPLIFL
jgi:hypothetical protein